MKLFYCIILKSIQIVWYLPISSLKIKNIPFILVYDKKKQQILTFGKQKTSIISIFGEVMEKGFILLTLLQIVFVCPY